MGSGGSSSGRLQSPRQAAADREEEAKNGGEVAAVAAAAPAPATGIKADPVARPREALAPPAPPRDKPCPLPPPPEAPPPETPSEQDAVSSRSTSAAAFTLSAGRSWQLASRPPPELQRPLSEAEQLARSIRLTPTDVHTTEEAKKRRHELRLRCRWRAPPNRKDIWGATVRGFGEQLKHDHNVMHRLEAGARARRKAAKVTEEQQRLGAIEGEGGAGDRGNGDSSSSKRKGRWRKRIIGHRTSKVDTIVEGDEEEKEELKAGDGRRSGNHGESTVAALADDASSELARRRTPSFGPSSVAALAASMAARQEETQEVKALVATPRKEVAAEPVPVDEEELEYGAAGLALLVQAARHRVATERFWSLGGSGERTERDAAAAWNAEWRASANPLLAAKEWSSPGWVTDLKAPDGIFGDRPASASTAAPSTYTARSTTSSTTTAASSHAPFLSGSLPLPRRDFGSGGWADSLMQKAGGARRPWSAMATVNEPGLMRMSADKKHLIDRRSSSPLPPGSRAMCPHPHAIDVVEEERLPSDLYLSDLDRYLMNKAPCLPPFDEPMFADNSDGASFPT